MKILLLGYGKEGKAAELYLKQHSPAAEFQIMQNFDQEDLHAVDFSKFDVIVRSPSVSPHWLESVGLTAESWTSATRIFFDKCPAKVVGVTGTKGKGTTSSIIAAILEALGKKVWLVGNIGTPAIEVLDEIQADDIVVYEMSSFQLWDLAKSPNVAVITGIEPDHLNIHADFDDYISAKGNIARHQIPDDTCIYFSGNAISARIASESTGRKISYAYNDSMPQDLYKVLQSLQIPGDYNKENATAAVYAAVAVLKISITELLEKHEKDLCHVFSTFKSLPHRLEFLRELHGVKYYDNNFSTTLSSTAVALHAFPGSQLIVIVGGRDKTDGKDLPEIAKMLEECAELTKIIFIGESGHELAKIIHHKDFEIAKSLSEAVAMLQSSAEALAGKPVIAMMSPAAASFDMFENVYDRGAKFQALIKELS